MNVLLATDGSRHAVDAARFLGSRLRPDGSVRIDLALVSAPEETASSRRGALQPFDPLWESEDVLRAAGLSTKRRVLTGDPGKRLVDAAKGYDLVAAGVKGQGASPFVELGGVARALLVHADTSVLLVRRRRREGLSGTEPPGSTRMLLAADGQGSAGRVALGLLEPFRIPPTELETVRVTHGRGRPARWIEERALQVGADLVVLDGRNGELPESAPLGSTAYEVAWSAPCSVLVVRARRASSADRAVGDPVRSAVEQKSRRARPSLEKDASM